MTSRIATWNWKQWFLTVATSATAGGLVAGCPEGHSYACSFQVDGSQFASDSPDTGQYGDFADDAASDTRQTTDANAGGDADASDDVVTDGATDAVGDH